MGGFFFFKSDRYGQKSNKHLHILLDCICRKWYEPLKSLIHFRFDMSDGVLQKIAITLSIIQNKINFNLHEAGVTNPIPTKKLKRTRNRKTNGCPGKGRLYLFLDGNGLQPRWKGTLNTVWQTLI